MCNRCLGILIVFVAILTNGSAFAAFSDALVTAVNSGADQDVKDQLAQGADPNAKDRDGWPLIMVAAANGHLAIVSLLLESKADPNATNPSGWTALMAATFRNHGEIVKKLIDGGADFAAKNHAGVTAVDIAKEKQLTNIIALFPAGFPGEGPTIEIPDNVRAGLTVGQMTEGKALALAEQFGVDVGEVDEEIQKFLGLTKAEGVVVFEVIKGSPAEVAGIKVKAIIKEVDAFEIHNLLDLGNALVSTLSTLQFSVATYEPTGIGDQGVTGKMNFHFVSWGDYK